MALIHALDQRSFSDAGPNPQVLGVGQHLAVMLLCLQKGQILRAPEGDDTETLFNVLSGEGTIFEDEVQHGVKAGDVVHLLPGQAKVLIAGDGTFAVLGVRHLRKRGA